MTTMLFAAGAESVSTAGTPSNCVDDIAEV
jgi:hypothetical protein